MNLYKIKCYKLKEVKMSIKKMIRKTFKKHGNKVNLRQLQTAVIKEKRRRYTAAMIKLEGKRCKKCKTTENLTRHHENGYDTNEVEILCRACHTKKEIENGQRKIHTEG